MSNKVYPVVVVFRDKHTGKKYPVGSAFETDDVNRAAELQSKGFIGELELVEPSELVEPTEPVAQEPTEPEEKGDADESGKIEPPDQNPEKPKSQGRRGNR